MTRPSDMPVFSAPWDQRQYARQFLIHLLNDLIALNLHTQDAGYVRHLKLRVASDEEPLYGYAAILRMAPREGLLRPPSHGITIAAHYRFLDATHRWPDLRTGEMWLAFLAIIDTGDVAYAYEFVRGQR